MVRQIQDKVDSSFLIALSYTIFFIRNEATRWPLKLLRFFPFFGTKSFLAVSYLFLVKLVKLLSLNKSEMHEISQKKWVAQLCLWSKN